MAKPHKTRSLGFLSHCRRLLGLQVERPGLGFTYFLTTITWEPLRRPFLNVRPLVGLEVALQKNRLEIDGLEIKVAEIATKLDQLPALIDKEKSFKKLGLEKELEQIKTRETQRAYVSDAGDTIASFSATVDEFQTAVEDLELSFAKTLADRRINGLQQRLLPESGITPGHVQPVSALVRSAPPPLS